VSEPESEGELSAIKSKRKASEVGFSIPPAKRPEPAEASVTESESDIDVVYPTRLPASASASTRKGTQQSVVVTALCSSQLLIGDLRAPVSVDDSVTESESDNGFHVEVVGDCLKVNLTH
jgi:hypothetical protein